MGRLDPEKGAHFLLERLAVVAAEEEPARDPLRSGRPARPGGLHAPPPPAHDGRRPPGQRVPAGFHPERHILRLYARYDAVVVPSLWQEPFSLVVPEALAAGTAVVASRRVGAAEWFEDGRDLLLFSPQAPWSWTRRSGA